MIQNTVRTFLGYLVTRFAKHVPLDFTGEDVEDVYNYLKINDLITTSGQPSVKQLSSISKRGFSTVINLLPEGTSNFLENECELVAAQGMEYIYIPVAWNNPTQEDFKQFVDAMTAMEGEKTWVHCAANIRVSVFMYKYRCEILGDNEMDAIWDLREIWEPLGVWKIFLPPCNKR